MERTLADGKNTGRWKEARGMGKSSGGGLRMAGEYSTSEMYYDVGPEICDSDLRRPSADVASMLGGWYTGYREVIVQTNGDSTMCAVKPSATVSGRAYALQHLVGLPPACFMGFMAWPSMVVWPASLIESLSPLSVYSCIRSSAWHWLAGSGMRKEGRAMQISRPPTIGVAVLATLHNILF